MITLVAALGSNRVIGCNGRLPWHLSADLRRFRRLTLGKPVVMGRRTFDSLGRPLPGRPNVVLTRDPAFAAPGVHRAATLDDAIRLGRALAGADGEIMVIGGGEVYRQALPLADRLELTLVDAAPAGDTFFPEWQAEAWRVTASERQEGDPAFTFLTLDRST